ncbi:unnamed protein product, partial [Mesorhabditis belari]|uniref:dynamin GTPase n=1 Tax=Mesorhabditis belari TaxID=2138241 RepID=A0AAF3FI88_9BILA
MESLIPTINKLQDVFAAVGAREAEIQLPQIVVVGSQSAGKSSVIEAVVGRDFLPRGVGIVTRRPLLLQLCHVPLNERETRQGRKDDWARFEHTGEKIFEDFELVRKEIEDETDRLTGSNKGIAAAPISLKIFSHRVVNLTLVDLPGMTKLPVGDQPTNIEEQIREMIMHYITNPNSIILAVTPANQDFATSEPLKMARDVDPEGARTLAVLTKLDLMDHGTDALDVLTGQLVQVKLGIIGVVNRSQADIKNKKPIDEALRDEEGYLVRKYPTLATRQGTRYLAKTLNRLLMHHIRECLPSLKNRVNVLMGQCVTLLNSYGEPVEDKNRTLLQIITRFSTAYTTTIEGTARNIETQELCGGARICYIFHETLAKTLEGIDPLEHLDTLDILTAIRNATGPRPALFVPEVAFELLVKRQIQRLEEPSLRCVDLVHEELQRIVQHCGNEIQQEMARFPHLFERIKDVVANVLKSRLKQTNSLVESLVAIELAYINTRHPEFTDANLVTLIKDSFVDNVAEREARVKQRNAAVDRAASVHESQRMMEFSVRARAESLNQPPNTVSPQARPQRPPYELPSVPGANRRDVPSVHFANVNLVYEFNGHAEPAQNQQQRTRDDLQLAQQLAQTQIPQHAAQRSGIFTQLFGGNSQQRPQAVDPSQPGTPRRPVNFLPEVPEKPPARKLTSKEQRDCEIIERLIKSYFFIVRKNVQDSVPKAIMHNMVNFVRENLQSELVRTLYDPSTLDELLCENKFMAQKRKDTAIMLETLHKAVGIIGEVRETYLL